MCVFFVCYICVYSTGKCNSCFGDTLSLLLKLDPPTSYYQNSSWTNFDGSDWFRFLCPFLPVFSLHSIYIHTCMYNIMFPVYLYSLYIHESSLSTWHDFIWTLCIKRNDLFVCISWGIVSLPIRKSWFLSPVDSEYIHYFVHVAANIFWLTGLYRFILCIVAAFYSKDWMLHDILCNILDMCFMLISFDNVLAIFVSCVC